MYVSHSNHLKFNSMLIIDLYVMNFHNNLPSQHKMKLTRVFKLPSEASTLFFLFYTKILKMMVMLTSVINLLSEFSPAIQLML